MEELAVRVEHVSKEYRLGAIGGATLRGEIQSALARLFHKEDPNLKIGEKAHGKNERFLALNDLSFDIKKAKQSELSAETVQVSLQFLSSYAALRHPQRATFILMAE